MPILDLQQRFDITPTTRLPLPGNGRVEFTLDGSIDVPNPLVAQQIYDALQKISYRAEEVLQERFDAGAHKSWNEKQSAKAIDSVLNNFYDRAAKAIDKVIDDYVQMNANFKITQRQKYAKSSLHIDPDWSESDSTCDFRWIGCERLGQFGQNHLQGRQGSKRGCRRHSKSR